MGHMTWPKHEKREYAKEVHCKVKKSLLRNGGTQCLDAEWKSLKGFFAKQIRKKVYVNGEGVVNARLRLQCMWAWRESLCNPSPGKCLEALQHLFVS